jgi:hypothetical protein
LGRHTNSARGASAVSDLGGIPIDYKNQDFVKEIHWLTSQGVDVVFDGIGGSNLWRSREALRPNALLSRNKEPCCTATIHDGWSAEQQRKCWLNDGPLWL